MMMMMATQAGHFYYIFCLHVTKLTSWFAGHCAADADDAPAEPSQPGHKFISIIFCKVFECLCQVKHFMSV